MSAAGAPRIAIVGAGVAGLSLAYALARLGRPAVVLERGRVGHQGASSGPAALVNPHRGASARAHPSDRAGLDAFWRVIGELRALGLDPEAHLTGVLRIAPSERRARAWQRLEEARWLPPESVPAPFHAPYGALLAEDGGWLRPTALLAALERASLALGTELREGVRVLRTEAEADAVRLVTSAGTLRASQVVLCVGADRSPELPLPPLDAVAGDVVTFETSSLGAPGVPLGGSVYAAFDAGSGFVGGNHRDPDQPDPEAPQRLLTSLDRWLPGAASRPGTQLWSGVRARAATPRPVVATVAPRVTFFGAFSGRGFLCAADLSARLAADLARDAAG